MSPLLLLARWILQTVRLLFWVEGSHSGGLGSPWPLGCTIVLRLDSSADLSGFPALPFTVSESTMLTSYLYRHSLRVYLLLFLLLISTPISLTTHSVWSHSPWTWSCGSVRTSTLSTQWERLSLHSRGVFRVSVIVIGASQVTRVKNTFDKAGSTGSISGSGRSPGGRNGNSLQYSCLENPMDRGAWRATVHGVTKSLTRLKWPSMHALYSGYCAGVGTVVRVYFFCSGMVSAGAGWRDPQWEQRAWGSPAGAGSQLRLRVGRVAAWRRRHGWEPRTGGSSCRAPAGLLLAVAAWMDLSHWRLASNSVLVF